jgi:L-2,4-diaminobutyrate decarboxylase
MAIGKGAATRRTRAMHQEVIAALWDRAATRNLGRQFAEIAANILLGRSGAVRQPRSGTLAARLLREAAATKSAAPLVRQIGRLSLNLAHPRYLAQQVAAPIPMAALIESVVAATNQSLAVWEMAPIATAIDRQLMARFKRLFRYPQTAEGTLVPGGAFGNLTALLAAREALKSRARRTAGPRMAVIVGAQAHYSISRAAAILGVDGDAVFRVPVDDEYRTDVRRLPEAFVTARRAGFRSFVLVGSVGSTPTGSFDQLEALRREATREGAWFHVDAAHGAALAFSLSLRSRVNGIGSADSLSFDPHKMMFMPLTAAGVLVRDGSLLVRPLAERAPYLFAAERRPWPDIGQLTIACSQRFDALKIWLVWQIYGARVWDALVTHTCAVCAAAFRYCARSSILEPLHAPHSNILCFRLRQRHGADSNQIHWKVKEELNESGYGYISSTVLDDRRVLRLVVMNPRTRAGDVEEVLKRIERIAKARRRRD